MRTHRGPSRSSLALRAACVLLVGSAAAAGEPPSGPTEQAVLDELNLARTRPAEYARFVERYLARFQDGFLVEVDGRRVRTTEGTNAVAEAIAFLQKAKPLPALSLAAPLSLAARDHARDIGPRGHVGHDGADGSQPADRIKRYGTVKRTCGENLAFGPRQARSIVMQLLVDDGVPGRGHRKNIFTPEYRSVGLAFGPHKTYEHLCVMDFADEIKAKEERR